MREYAKFIVDSLAQVIKLAGGQIHFLRFEDRVKDYGHQIDGYLIPGGRDLNPMRYGEENKGSIFHEIDGKCRWDHLADAVENLNPKIPIMGICLGMQFLNCYFGGSLNQHIDNSVEHNEMLRHLSLTQDSHISRAFSSLSALGVCYHHQGLARLSPSFRVSAFDTLDGSIHAIDYIYPDRVIFGVMWHPESKLREAAAYDQNLQLFKYLVKIADSVRYQKTGGDQQIS